MFANWFGKRGRGTIIGFWQSCSNFGNITGALAAGFLSTTVNLKWEYTYMLIGFACVGMSIINYFFMVVDPIEKGIVIHEIDEKMN